MAEMLPFDRAKLLKNSEINSLKKAKGEQAYLLHLDLDLFFGEESGEDSWEMEVLQQYGHVKQGITRDVLVPSDMNLTALHYLLLRCFGWRDSHLHDFTLPDAVFQKLTGGIETPDAMGRVVYDGPFRRWADLCGVYFRLPVDDSEDERWMGAYDESMKFETWLRRRYTGPYRYIGEQEHYAFANTAIHKIMERFPMVREDIPFHEWVELQESGRLDEEQTKRVVPVNQARIQDMNPYFEQQLTNLLERLSVAELLVPEQQDRDPDAALRKVNDLLEQQEGQEEDPQVIPLSSELKYCYDYGDGWEVYITCMGVYSLQESGGAAANTSAGTTTVSEVQRNPADKKETAGTSSASSGEAVQPDRETIRTVIEQNKPVCIAADGLPVMDDVGGISGYIQFLDTLHHGAPEERRNAREWARSTGWTGRMKQPKNIL